MHSFDNIGISRTLRYAHQALVTTLLDHHTGANDNGSPDQAHRPSGWGSESSVGLALTGGSAGVSDSSRAGDNGILRALQQCQTSISGIELDMVHTESDVVAVLCVDVVAESVEGPATIVLAVLETDVVAVDWVDSVGLTVEISAVSVFAVRESSGVCASIICASSASAASKTL